jgi:putative SOS response-associated peptidase YedK
MPGCSQDHLSSAVRPRLAAKGTRPHESLLIFKPPPREPKRLSAEVSAVEQNRSLAWLGDDGVLRSCRFACFHNMASWIRLRPLGWSKKNYSSIGPGLILRYSPKWIEGLGKDVRLTTGVQAEHIGFVMLRPNVRRRCLVPPDGFYEWQRTGRSRQPYCFEMVDGKPFAFAGLWDRWRAPDGTPVETCTILTTTPNQLLAGIHDRMPAILKPEDYDSWLDPGFRDADATIDRPGPFDGTIMRRYPVGERVNNVANDGAKCSEPVALQVPSQTSLF